MFTKKDITGTIMRLVRDRYGVYCNISKNTTFAELKFDKFDVLYMVMACEEYFGIHITEEEAATLRDVKSLITLVINKLNEVGLITTEKVKSFDPGPDGTDHGEATPFDPGADEVPEFTEEEAKEAMEDAKSNDGVPTVKTEGDFEREDMEAEKAAQAAEEKLPETPAEVKGE